MHAIAHHFPEVANSPSKVKVVTQQTYSNVIRMYAIAHHFPEVANSPFTPESGDRKRLLDLKVEGRYVANLR